MKQVKLELGTKQDHGMKYINRNLAKIQRNLRKLIEQLFKGKQKKEKENGQNDQEGM